MGSIPPFVSECTSKQSIRSGLNKHTQNFDFKAGSNHSFIKLSHFRQMLSKGECLYVLSTLLQQYYNLYKQYSKVVVSDQLCRVTSFGEVKVDFCIDGPETPLSLYNQVTHSFVTTVSQVLEVVAGLASSQSGLENQQYSYLQNRIIKIIYQLHSNEDKLYQELLQQINAYMQGHRIKCNLIASLIRLKESESHSPLYKHQFQDITPYIGFSRSRSQSQFVHPLEFRESSSYSNVELEDRSVIYKIKDNSTKVDSHIGLNQLSRQKRSRNSTYRHKMVRTEGEAFYNSMNAHYDNRYNFHQRFLSEAPPTTERPISKEQSEVYSKNNHISAQFSINIQSAFAKQKQAKVKFKKREVSGSSCKQNDSQGRSCRKKTSIQQIRSGKPRKDENSHIYTKSVLNDLARSVEVQEEPSSRSYIF